MVERKKTRKLNTKEKWIILLVGIIATILAVFVATGIQGLLS